MKTIKEGQFVDMLKGSGIEIDLRYPQSSDLSYGTYDYSRFWLVPQEARRIPYFVKTIIESIDEWQFVHIWKHRGSWTTKIKGERINDDLQSIIFAGIGIPDATADIILLDRNESTRLIALMFNQLVFGWGVQDDIYIIPDHRNAIVKTSHHNVIHTEFPTETLLNKFIDSMTKEGFDLPRDIPDATFKRPKWMKSKNG
ncbi:MAG TPA: hypothetical protein VLX91_08250 [Candidatus Acidoferrales bacterium]|nr:hypothetical protein [Candidatus Acidoferrales bacterium]